MSRSNRTDAVNPATRFFSWKGGEGVIVYYDKEAKLNVEVPMPFNFLVLDQLVGASGGKEIDGAYSSYWSNAIRDTRAQKLVVRSKAGVVARGYYEDIKGKDGIKFQQLLYIAFYDDEKNLQIGCLKLSGSSLGAWFEFKKIHRDIYDGAISIKEKSDKKKKGSNVYYEPVFDRIAIVSDESEAMAKELDTHLQEYFTAYFSNAAIEEVEVDYTGRDDEFSPDTTGTPPDDDFEDEEGEPRF